MTMDYVFWSRDEDESSGVMLPDRVPQGTDALPIFSNDGRMIFLGMDKTKAAGWKSQPMKFFAGPHHAKVVPHSKLEGYTICGKGPAKELRAYVDYWSVDAAEARKQILEPVSTKA